MENVILSEKYFIACNRIHEEATSLYERIHDNDGSPIKDETLILSAIQSSMRSISIELDLIKSCCFECNDNE